MGLSSGTRLGVYEILSPLGAGGMGEVYRARDTKLNREVALKVLPAAFSANRERVSRFEREARMLASLNHPHIGAIYGLEDAGLAPALVLELIEGDTLEERLRRGPMAVREALTVAQQIGDALGAAHTVGIIHRDLKPSNIKITPDERVKVLDFGIAKAIGTAEIEPDVAAATTLTTGHTNAGAVLGTARYMSPEQARGQPVDKRSDIWAFGCVLFEMLTGAPAFVRTTAADTTAAVLAADPVWTSLPDTTPDGVRRLLLRCLQKDPKRRLHDIADARIEIEDLLAAPAEAISPSARRRPLTTIAALALAVALGSGALLGGLWATQRRLGRPAPTAIADTSVTRLTDLFGLEESPAVSPDGRSLAFTAGVGGRRQIFVRLLAGTGPPLQLTHGAADHESPRWTPDSSAVVYFSPAAPGDLQGSLWEIPALGGAPRRIVNSIGSADVSSADGRLAFFRLADGGIQLVTALRDGSTTAIVSRFAPSTYYLYPRWSPDGRWIAFQRGDSIRFDVFAAPAAGGEPRQLTRDNNMMSGFAWLPDSSGVVYSSSRGGTMPYLPSLDLWEAALEGGEVRRVTSGEMSYVSPDISKSGTIMVSRMRLQTDIWQFPVDGSPVENVRRGVRLTRQTGQVLTPTANPQGNEVAFLSDSGGHANLWVVNTETGALRQITHERDPAAAMGVRIWSPDGRTIAFVSSRGNQGLTFGVWLVDPDGSNLRNIANPGLGPAWSPDGRWVYYATRAGAAATDVVLKKISVAGGAAVTVTTERLRNVIGLDRTTLYYSLERPLMDGRPEFEIRVATPENAPFRVLARIPASRVPVWQIVNPVLSPDGKWLAQALTDGFTTNVWALSTTTGEWRQLTDFGDRTTFIARRVSWSADGRSILAAIGEGDADIVMLEGLTGRRPN